MKQNRIGSGRGQARNVNERWRGASPCIVHRSSWHNEHQPVGLVKRYLAVREAGRGCLQRNVLARFAGKGHSGILAGSRGGDRYGRPVLDDARIQVGNAGQLYRKTASGGNSRRNHKRVGARSK